MAYIRRRLSSESTDEFDMNEATTLLDNEVSPSDPEVPHSEEKVKYPKAVFFIVTNEFCERFSYYGMRTILAIYLRNILLYTDDEATVIYHVFAMLCYFFPLIGAMLADTLLGKFNTIFYISIVYALGNVLVSVASSDVIPAREFSIVGLLLIAFGTGGIKPCVSAFGGDQFKLPQQERQLQQFFSLFYFSINSGSLISTFITPILREDVKCLDQDSCYPLAFGVPAILMIIAIIIFLLGKRLYIIKKPEGNIVLRVCGCIFHALVRRPKLKEKREHWLDYADDKYDKTLINDTKATLRVLFLYLPLPIFWALFDQQGSRWTFQATRMTGEIGDWSLKPDQMQVVNPLLILIFIPIFEGGIYPLLAKCNLLKRPLQRLGVGGLLAALAFVVSAIVELQLEDTYAVLPQSGEAQLRVFNGFNCPAEIVTDQGPVTIPNNDFWSATTLPARGNESYDISVEFNTPCIVHGRINETVGITEGQARSYFITYSEDRNSFTLVDLSPPYDTIDKSQAGNPLLRVIYSYNDSSRNLTLRLDEVDGNIRKEIQLDGLNYRTEAEEIDSTTYRIEIDGHDLGNHKIRLGGVYTLLIQQNGDEFDSNLLIITEPNSMHMLWLIPQYFIITMGEVMFSITGLEFSFTQAPVSMKSVLQAAWLLTVAFGNLIVVIVAEAKFFDSQANEFFLFAGLMVVDMAVFALMAMKYKYVEAAQDGDDEGEENLKDNGFPLKEKSEKNGVDNAAYKTDD